jgi:hypothetical protein
MTSSDVLTANDRCDRCGAQAYVEVRLDAGSLLFCAHHYRQFEGPLRSMTDVVADERLRLHALS